MCILHMCLLALQHCSASQILAAPLPHQSIFQQSVAPTGTPCSAGWGRASQVRCSSQPQFGPAGAPVCVSHSAARFLAGLSASPCASLSAPLHPRVIPTPLPVRAELSAGRLHGHAGRSSHPTRFSATLGDGWKYTLLFSFSIFVTSDQHKATSQLHLVCPGRAVPSPRDYTFPMLQLPPVTHVLQGAHPHFPSPWLQPHTVLPLSCTTFILFQALEKPPLLTKGHPFLTEPCWSVPACCLPGARLWHHC